MAKAKSHLPQTVNIGNSGVITNTTIPWQNVTSNNMMWGDSGTAQPIIEHHIKGEMLHVQKSFDFTHRMNSPVDDDTYKDNIKKQLVEMLVNELWKTKHVEFTMIRDQSSNHDLYRARICTVPDTQVRILRERGLPK